MGARIPYLRIYYERGNGRVVLDSGPGTERTEVADVDITGRICGEHSMVAGARPRFWMTATNCSVTIRGGVAFVTTETV
jgi:hypothetical protein